MLLTINVGQASPPFSARDRISVLVLCGRDDPPADNGTEVEQVDPRAQRYLRDLRREAVVDYRETG